MFADLDSSHNPRRVGPKQRRAPRAHADGTRRESLRMRQPIDGRGSSRSVTTDSTEGSRTCRSHEMSRTSRIRLAPMAAPTIVETTAMSPAAAWNPRNAPRERSGQRSRETACVPLPVAGRLTDASEIPRPVGSRWRRQRRARCRGAAPGRGCASTGVREPAAEPPVLACRGSAAGCWPCGQAAAFARAGWPPARMPRRGSCAPSPTAACCGARIPAALALPMMSKAEKPQGLALAVLDSACCGHAPTPAR